MYNSMDPYQESAIKNYNYSYGTPYYLIDKKYSAITYSISYDGTNFMFTPNKHIYGLCDPSQPIIHQSLLAAAIYIMSQCANYAILCSIKDSWDPTKYNDPNFKLPYAGNIDGTKCMMYVDYTNNMVFPDDKEYGPLSPYIFPNRRRQNNSNWNRDKFLPKDVIEIQFQNDLSTKKYREYHIKDFFKKYLETFKELDKIQTLLKCLKVKEQIDIPTKFIVFGICNQFGKTEQSKKALVSLLYIEHKISLGEYEKFKEICNDTLDKLLKPFDKDHEYVLNMTNLQAKNDFKTFEDIDKIARKCGYLKDPREMQTLLHYSYMFEDDSIYYEDFGLSRWKGIKTYYPELYKGLRIILDRYNELKIPYIERMNKMYNNKFIEVANQKYNNILTSDDDINNEFELLIRKIQQIFSKLDSIKVDEWDELINVFTMINQEILDSISEVYTNEYKKKILEYSYNHPRAKKMEFVFDTDKLNTGYTWVTDNLLTIYPFENLPLSIKNILNNKKIENLQLSLNKFKVFNGVSYDFYINGQKLKWRNNISNQRVYQIENLKDALANFEFKYSTKYCAGSDNHRDLITANYDLSKCISNQSVDSIEINVKDLEQTIHAILTSPFKLNLLWQQKSDNIQPKLFEPIEDTGNPLDGDKYRYHSEKSFDALINDFEINLEKIKDKIDFHITCEYENEKIIERNLLQVDCIKQNVQL